MSYDIGQSLPLDVLDALVALQNAAAKHLLALNEVHIGGRPGAEFESLLFRCSIGGPTGRTVLQVPLGLLKPSGFDRK